MMFTLREVNGVFEGGGSKGLLYIGALQACEKQRVRFRAVAGSSAGAMTAMLIACGYTSAELKEKIPEAMDALGSPRRALAAVIRKSVLSSDTLRAFLSAAAHEKIEPATGDEVTFADVRRATEISLYVVSMDLASGQPLVFSPDLTPSMPIADAVVASAAIPVAFPAQRVEIDGEMHRLVDGGVWANYPSFVFLDDDFRETHDLRDGADDRETIGFLLDSIPPRRVAPEGATIRPLAPIPHPHDLGSAERQLGAFGGLITSPALKVAAVLLPLLVLILGVSWFDREVDSNLELIGRLPAAIQDIVLILLVLVFTFLVVQTAVLAFLVIRLGRALTDEGLVGTTAAMGVGPNVPYWVGEGRGRHSAVRLPVPADLKTLTSHPSDDLTERSLSAGREATLRMLSGEPPLPPAPPTATATFPGPVTSTVLFWIGAIASALLAFSVVRATGEGRVAWYQLIGLFIVGAAMLVTHAMRRTRRAELGRTWLDSRSRGQLLTFAVVGSVLAAVAFIGLFASESEQRELSIHERMTAVTTVTGKVIAIEPGGDGFADDDWIVSVSMPGVPLSQYYLEDGEEVPYWDLDSEDIWPCLDWEDGLLSEPCYEFTTNAVFSTGQSVPVSYDASEGVIFLEPDRWSLPGLEAFLLVAVGGITLLAARAWRAWRFKEDRDTAGIDLREPRPVDEIDIRSESRLEHDKLT